MEELDKKISEIVRSTVKEFMESLLKGRFRPFLRKKKAREMDITRGTQGRDMGK